MARPRLISIVTVVFNRANTIRRAIDSVLSQDYAHVEYVIIDGGSTDGTSLIVEEYRERIDRIICEPDDGLYDALNKGVSAASGDAIGFLHADDFFFDARVVARIAQKFNEHGSDAVYGDLEYVNEQEKVVRKWQAGKYDRDNFSWGWMPPHPTVYVRREIYERFGGYRTDMGSAADYECMIRLMVKNQISVGYIPEVLVRMQTGGQSNVSLKARLIANGNDQKAWTENGLRPPFGLRFTKPLSKIPQYLFR
ncbi:MAG: glycosyltransferase family 2 protein [Planctomycetota bacterium]